MYCDIFLNCRRLGWNRESARTTTLIIKKQFSRFSRDKFALVRPKHAVLNRTRREKNPGSHSTSVWKIVLSPAIKISGLPALLHRPRLPKLFVYIPKNIKLVFANLNYPQVFTVAQTQSCASMYQTDSFPHLDGIIHKL